ncbi:DUF7544 domain-containing protein [Methanosarcina sp. Mfa9]|uniref:DUF7544 domain-containing protein n=1 Tax=Methanosarcina sp. Mfa9 TaxID=3439063 RepID=UPI003F86F561
MGWYSIDAVDRAFSRTRKALFEPFDFWKWAKLALIIFFVGGAGSNFGGNYGGSGNNYQASPDEFEDIFPEIDPGQIAEVSGIIIAGIVLVLLLVLVFSYISSVMEFVFVESLVKNEVLFWAYSRKFLGKGFNLLLIRFGIGLVFLLLIGIAALPLVSKLLENTSDFSWPALVGGFIWLFAVITGLAILGSFINSFLNFAIPLSIYRETGILSAFGLAFGNFRKSWKELLVYWVVRFFLMIGITIFVVILSLILFLAFGLVFLIVDGVLYFLFSALVSGTMLWVLLIPFVLLELLVIFVAMLFLGVPFAVFIKYHMLSFLEAWYPESEIPMFNGFSSSEPEITGF